MSRRDSWRVSLALLLAFSVVVAGLHTVLNGFEAWFVTMLIVLAVLAAAAIARARSRRRWLPTLVSSLTLVASLTVGFETKSSFVFVLPSLDTFRRFGDLAASGAEAIRTSGAPMDATPGILFLLALGVGGLAIVADLMAITWRTRALAGVPLLVVLSIPPAVGTGFNDILIFALAAASYLLLLRAGHPVPQRGRAFAVGALAVAATIILPLVLPPMPQSEASTGGFGGYLYGVNPVLNLGADLRRDLPRTMLNYSTRTDAPNYLRLVSLQNFTAETWAPDDPDVELDNRPNLVGAPPGLSSEVRVTSETTWVDVGNLSSPWLPVPYPATSVTGISGDWYWDADALTFASPNRTANGETFRVESLDVQPTPAQLASAGAVTPPGFGRYTQLPANLPAVISATAARVTSGVSGNYAKAVALQNFFRNGEFDYSETAPEDNGYDGTGMEMLASFLTAKSGYCVHFASAMAVMARTLDIPSRVAVGFLPGQADGDLVEGRKNFRMTTRDLHTWPELYFEGVGWIRFEPTPGRGFVPSYADEATPGVPTPPVAPPVEPSAAPSASPSPTAVAAPLDPTDPTAADAATTTTTGWLVAALAAMGVLGLLLIPAGIRWLQRGVRMHRLAARWPSARSGWRELLCTAEDLGIEVSAGETPRQIAESLAAAVRLPEAAQRALERVLTEIEAQSFAPRKRSVNPRPHAADLSAVIVGLRSGSRRRARVVAALAPRSVFALLRPPTDSAW